MLLSSSLATPAIGTIFWTTLIFILFFLLLTKFAWKPILSAVKAREEMIKGSLESAQKAREVLGWKPIFGMEEGLGRTVDWYRQYFSQSGVSSRVAEI